MERFVSQTENPATDKPPRPRRRIPMSLRMFVGMLVILGVGGPLWVGIPVYRQHVAVRQIERLGGSGESEYHGPEWLPRLLEYESARNFDRLMSIRLGGTRCSDDDLRDFRGLTNVDRLVLYNTRVTDAGLSRLRGLPGLKHLYLHGTNVTDSGITRITALSNLQSLDLADTRITDAGLARLKELKNLRRLYINDTQVTDSGIADLQRALPGLAIFH